LAQRDWYVEDTTRVDVLLIGRVFGSVTSSRVEYGFHLLHGSAVAAAHVVVVVEKVH
jgi:hypothetical protein